MKRISILIVAFILFAIPAVVSGVTYNWYFNDSTGNDTTGDGSIGSPWANEFIG